MPGEPNELTPREEQNRAQAEVGYGAIHLVREGDHAVVAVTVGALWIPVIREHVDGPFSHIVEPRGIERAIANYFSEREILFEFKSHIQWVRMASRWFAESLHTSLDTICIDAKGRVVGSGAGFARAEREGTFPVKVYSTRSEQAVEARNG